MLKPLKIVKRASELYRIQIPEQELSQPKGLCGISSKAFRSRLRPALPSERIPHKVTMFANDVLSKDTKLVK